MQSMPQARQANQSMRNQMREPQRPPRMLPPASSPQGRYRRSRRAPTTGRQDTLQGEESTAAAPNPRSPRGLTGRPSGARQNWAYEQASHEPPEQSVECACEQNDDAADDDDHVTGDCRLLEGEFCAALVENAEEERRQHNAGGMRTSHQRHGDPDEAIAGSELEQKAMLIAHQLVDREP